MEPESKVAPTHINAYINDLGEAEKEAANAVGRVNSLRHKVAELRAEQDGEAEVAEVFEVHLVDDTPEPEEEELAPVADPTDEDDDDESDDDDEPADEPDDAPEHDPLAASAVDTSKSHGADEPADDTATELDSEPVTETPNEASDMPPASSEVPQVGTTGDSVSGESSTSADGAGVGGSHPQS
jgi:hypothetical protein